VHPLHLRPSRDCLIYFQLFFHRDSGCLNEDGNLSPKDKKVLSSAVCKRKQEAAINNMKINQHVVKRTDGWAVVGEGNSRDTSVHQTQHQAIERAREIAQNQRSEVVIHGEDGKIRDKNSYGNDSFPPRG